MPDATITSTASTFGTISGVFSADQSTISGTISGIIPGTLTGSVGVPGPAGAAGAPGQGVPAGGTAGQYLQKIDGTNYNTDWVTLNLSGYALLSGADFTGRVTVPGIAGDYAGFNIGTTSADPDAKANGDLWVYDGTGITPSSLKVILDSETRNIATEYWVTTGFAPKASPVFTGDPRAPTPASGDNDTSIATTAFVKVQGYITSAALTGYAPLASPVFTGNPTAPTPTFGDNDTSIATTAFVQAGLLGGTANARNLEVYVRNQSGASIPAGSIVYISGATGNRPLITLSQANNDANSAQTMGFTKTAIANNAFGYVIVRGEVENLDTSALTEGAQLYLSPTVAGAYTTTKPTAPQHLVYVGIVIRAHPTLGTILVAVQNGYELGEIHDVALGTLANNDLLAYESSTDLWKNKTFSALGLLTSADAATTYAPKASPALTGTPLSTTAAADTNTTQIATTAFVVGQAGSATPLVDGTAAVGTSLRYARQDHVHGTDTTRAPLASPAFTGTPSLPTGTTAVTQTAGNNTTALATTAFVTAAVPAIATEAQARQGLSETVASAPYDVITAMMTPGYRPNLVWGTTSSGTGASVGNAASAYQQIVGPNVGVAGYAIAYTTQFLGLSAGFSDSVLRFNKPIRLSGSLNNFSSSWPGDANNEMKIFIGNSPSGGLPPTNYGDPSSPAIGWKKIGGASSVFQLMVHNGTTLTTVNSSVTLTNGVSTDWEIRSDGAGNVQLYLNGTLAASTSAGPSGVQANIACIFQIVGQTASAAARLILNATYTKLWVAPQN
jgi:hypothetical protein